MLLGGSFYDENGTSPSSATSSPAGGRDEAGPALVRALEILEATDCVDQVTLQALHQRIQQLDRR